MRFEYILDAMDEAEDYYTGYVLGLALLKANHPELSVCKQEIPSTYKVLDDDWDMASEYRGLHGFVKSMAE